MSNDNSYSKARGYIYTRYKNSLEKGASSMNGITKETRKESYLKKDLTKKQKLIYRELDKPMTARELAMKIRKKRFNKNS